MGFTRAAAPMPRLDYFDGLRTVAVIWVVLYHYLYFWTYEGSGFGIVAFDSAFIWLPLVSVGYLGVNLFFIISGFVILLTLEKSTSFIEFMMSRAIRLWPPLILFGTITFVTMHAFGPTELRVSSAEYVISLLFLPPQHIGLVVGEPGWTWLDGSYWSLHVEIKFYVFFGLLFFLFNRFYLAMWVCFEATILTSFIVNCLIDSGSLDLISRFFFQRYISYFSLGIAGYLYYSGRRGPMTWVVGLFGLFDLLITNIVWHLGATVSDRFLIEDVVGRVFMVLVVWLYLLRGWRLPAVASAPAIMIGRSSYGIYLIHQNFGISVLASSIFATPFIGAVGVLALMVAITLAAIWSFQRIEMPLQAALRARLIRRAGLNGGRPTADMQLDAPLSSSTRGDSAAAVGAMPRRDRRHCGGAIR